MPTYGIRVPPGAQGSGLPRQVQLERSDTPFEASPPLPVMPGMT